ncbi:MAG: type II toxin-antitoxin system VapC family toxin [Micrococcales bacterium]|nr:type II toxin-antitoxin system VapC family toxin [Micrococcales bacterium]
MLDTNILIFRHSLDPGLLPDEAAISAVVLGELAAGVHLVPKDRPDADRVRADRLALLQQAESEFDAVPYGAEAARMFGRMSAAVGREGRSPRARTSDLMIAATAAVEGLPLFTANPDDFRGLAELVEIRPVPHP